MIRVLGAGEYRLVERTRQVKILYLDTKPYVWLATPGVGQLLIATHRSRESDRILGAGRYRLYDVKDEPDLSGHKHLELSLGGSRWQGYILLSGLPTSKKPHSKVLATNELISSPTMSGSPVR